MTTALIGAAATKAAEGFNNMGTGSKLAVSYGVTLTSPAFWVGLIIIVLISTFILWIINPCFLRSEKDPNIKDCNGYAPFSFWKSLGISIIIVGPILYVIAGLLMYLVLSGGASLVSKYGKYIS